jgi:hypothetical protein
MLADLAPTPILPGWQLLLGCLCVLFVIATAVTVVLVVVRKKRQ